MKAQFKLTSLHVDFLQGFGLRLQHIHRCFSLGDTTQKIHNLYQATYPAYSCIISSVKFQSEIELGISSSGSCEHHFFFQFCPSSLIFKQIYRASDISRKKKQNFAGFSGANLRKNRRRYDQRCLTLFFLTGIIICSFNNSSLEK